MFASFDPTGAETLKGNPGLPLDFVWVLICGFLVMFMQAGFALIEAGFSRAKNVANVMMKNLMDFAVGSLAFFVVGFALIMELIGMEYLEQMDGSWLEIFTMFQRLKFGSSC